MEPPSSPHRLALFSLIATGDPETKKRTEAIIADKANENYVTWIPTHGQLGINIGFNILSASRCTLATLGRDANITVKGEHVSRTQCSFEVVPETGIVMLYDRSTSTTTQFFGEDAIPFESGRLPRRVAVTPHFNTTFGFFHRGHATIQFKIIWHDLTLDVLAQLNNRQETPRRARTLDEVPTVLAYERQQYNSPPPYPSGTTTRSPSPDRTPTPLTEADRHAIRKQERLQSTPWWQFDNQTRMETKRIIYQIEERWTRRKATLPFDTELEFVKNATNNVRNRWREQGIWSKEWDAHGINSTRWIHEEIPGPPPHPSPPLKNLFDFGRRPSKSKAPSPATIEKQKAAHELATVASRPYYQFLFQLSTEREWVIDDSLEDLSESEIEARAYENVRNSWIKQKIWNPSWGHFQGTIGCMSIQMMRSPRSRDPNYSKFQREMVKSPKLIQHLSTSTKMRQQLLSGRRGDRAVQRLLPKIRRFYVEVQEFRQEKGRASARYMINLPLQTRKQSPGGPLEIHQRSYRGRIPRAQRIHASHEGS